MSDINEVILDDLKDLARALRDHVFLIIAFTVLVCLAAFFLLVTTPDRYRAQSMLMLDNRDFQSETVRLPEMAMTDEEKVLLTEIEIIRSREVIDPVIREFSLDKRAEFNPELPSPSRLERFALWSEDAVGVDPLAMIGLQQPATFDDRISGTADHVRPVAREMGLGAAEATNEPAAFPAAVYRKIYGSLSTRIRGGSRIVEVAFASSNPVLAKGVANALAETYLVKRKQSAATDATSTRGWLDERIAELEDEVRALESEFTGLQEDSGILETGRAPILAQQIEQLSDRLTLMRTEEAELNARYERIRGSLAGNNYDALIELVDTPQMGALKAELAGRLAEVSNLRARLGNRHPDLIAAQNEVETLQQQIRAEGRAHVAQLSQQVMAKGDEAVSLESRLKALRTELAGMGQERATLSSLEREIDAKRDLLNSFLERRAQLNAAQDQRVFRSPLTLVSRATEPQLPFSPNRRMMMMVAAVLGVVLGVIAALLLDLMSKRLRRRSQLKQVAGRVRILGYLPPEKASWGGRFSVARRDNAKALYDEAARRLQGSLMLALKSAPGQPGKVVMLTSSKPGEGKTTTAHALAEKAARSGAHVLLVNCDPKTPTGRFEPTLEQRNGVIEILREECPVDLAITAVAGSENLDSLPAGNLAENNQDLLGGPAMDTLLRKLRDAYDLVILDAPPLMSLSYVLPLGIKADFVAYVARWRRAGVREVIEGVRQFQDYDIPVGLVMTDMRRGAAARFGLRPIQSYYRAYTGKTAEI